MLKVYELASGQTVNLGKSALCFSPNVSVKFHKVLSNILTMPLVNNLGKYLEISPSFTRRKGENFKEIQQRVQKILQGWKGKMFSTGGKDVLIKSVAHVIPSYIMSCFRLPQAFCNELHKYMTSFWWRSMKSNRKIHWKR